MFVPRTNAHLFDDCSSDDSCTPVGAIVGQDPTEQETDPTTSTDSTTDWTRPGPHRYIGIWIVVGLIIVVIALYLTCARRPRRFFSRHFRRKSLSPKQEMQEVKALGGPFIAPNPLIAQPEKARPKSGRSGHGASFFGGRMVAEHSSSNKYLIQSEWDVQQPQKQADRSSDDHSQKPIYPMRRPPS